jgi:AcrR family transcriptional regulator
VAALEATDPEHTRIVIAAERLIGQRGIEVTASEVATAAGLANESAITEKFGSLDLLIEAIWYLHSAPVNLERARLISRLPQANRRTTRQFVEAWLKPLVAELRRYSPSYWARFNEQYLIKSPLLFNRDMEAELDELEGAHPLHVLAVLYRELERHLQRIDAHHTPQSAQRRASLAWRAGMHWLAVWEREAENPQAPTPDLNSWAEEVTVLVVGMLEMPASRPMTFL